MLSTLVTTSTVKKDDQHQPCYVIADKTCLFPSVDYIEK